MRNTEHTYIHALTPEDTLRWSVNERFRGGASFRGLQKLCCSHLAADAGKACFLILSADGRTELGRGHAAVKRDAHA